MRGRHIGTTDRPYPDTSTTTVPVRMRNDCPKQQQQQHNNNDNNKSDRCTMWVATTTTRRTERFQNLNAINRPIKDMEISVERFRNLDAIRNEFLLSFTVITMSSVENKDDNVANKDKDLLSTVVKYPEWMDHEEELRKNPYGVPLWELYLSSLEEALYEARRVSQTTKNQEKLISIGGGGDGVRVGDLRRLVETDLVPLLLWVGQRATQMLPGSYKLWRHHLLLQQKLLRDCNSSSLAWELSVPSILRSYRVALQRLHKMPRIWMDAIEFFQEHCPYHVTLWRRWINQALEALPVTQHEKLRSVVLPFVDNKHNKNNKTDCRGLPLDTELTLLRRYSKFHPPHREILAQRCLDNGRPAEAAVWLSEILNDDTFVSPTGQPRYDLWLLLANTCCQYPHETQRVGIDFDQWIRGSLTHQRPNNDNNHHHKDKDGSSETAEKTNKNKQGRQANEDKDTGETLSTTPSLHFGEMEGTLWAKLANYYIRAGEFEVARGVYEEGMESVSRVRDFTILFDAYIQLEEGILESLMGTGDEEEEEEEEATDGATNQGDQAAAKDEEEDWDLLLQNTRTAPSRNNNNKVDLEWALSRAEHLTARRPLLLNRVLLKQNPHNVGEWLLRAKLYEDQSQWSMSVETLKESLRTVQARHVVNGTPSQLVTRLAALYESNNEPDQSRLLLKNVCWEGTFAFRDVDDLAQCWGAWVELELRHECWDEALSIARQAVARPTTAKANRGVTKGLVRSLRLWDLLLDLEESLGTVQTTKDAYNRALEVKVATPVHILNFCSFLKDQRYFEEAFGAYERGVEAFDFPAVKVLWKSYLRDFMERYKGQQHVERTRDLLARCLESCPPEDAAEFFLQSASFEEEYGLTQRALRVYQTMCATVPSDKDKYTAYRLWIAKTTKYRGLPATRDIYQQAVQTLSDRPAAQLCLDFCKMETTLHELDRARAILVYGAQAADPRAFPEYWLAWHDFEVSHGNEETFREMLRIKRTVQAAFSTVNYNATGMAAAQEESNLTTEEAVNLIIHQEGVDVLEDQPHGAQEISQNATSTTTTTAMGGGGGGFVPAKRTATAALQDVEDRVAKLRKVVVQNQEDGDEIDIDDDDDDDEEEEGGGDEQGKSAAAVPVRNVSTKQVPDAVFGGLANKAKQ